MRLSLLLALAILIAPVPARADLWGGDLPLLAQIVTNTLQTLYQLREQTRMMEDEMDGIKDKIYRIQTIYSVVEPSTWDEWKDPQEALRRLRVVYRTLPPEYRSPKSDQIEDEISKAMNLVARLAPESKRTFSSGKEMEERATDSSPGVAQKLTASGIGSLVAMEAQNQALQSHIVSLLAQTLANANEQETRGVVSRGNQFKGLSTNLGQDKGWFSNHVIPFGWY